MQHPNGVHSFIMFSADSVFNYIVVNVFCNLGYIRRV